MIMRLFYYFCQGLLSCFETNLSKDKLDAEVSHLVTLNVTLHCSALRTGEHEQGLHDFVDFQHLIPIVVDDLDSDLASLRYVKGATYSGI